MKLKSLIAAFAMVLGLSTAAYANGLVRTVDSFDYLVDYSGSMMMTEQEIKMPKMEIAKEVLNKITKAIPDLGYKASMHTLAPAHEIVAYGDFAPVAMEEAVGSLQSDLAIYGRKTPLGNGINAFAPQYEQMARPTAIILVSDGLNNLGIEPVKSIVDNNIGACFHIISFADSAEGQATLDEIAKINDCTVMVNGVDLYKDDAALNDFVQKVFYAGLANDALVLRGVNFAFDSAVLTDEAKEILGDVAVIIKDAANGVALQGWTDSVGTEAYNKALSQRRAESVKAYLVQEGLDAGKIEAKGMGKSFKYDNSNADGRYLNRRVEVLVK